MKQAAISNFTFVKPYSTKIRKVEGQLPVNISFNIGDVISGKLKAKSVPIPDTNKSITQKFVEYQVSSVSRAGIDNSIDIPFEYFKEKRSIPIGAAPAPDKESETAEKPKESEQPKESEGMFSGKNILIGLVGIAAIYGIYKYMKS